MGELKEKYGNREFCKAIKCSEMATLARSCSQCRAYQFHDYLITHGYDILRDAKEPARGNSFGIPWKEGGMD